MTVGGSVHFGNITGPLYDAGKEFRMYIIIQIIMSITATKGACSKLFDL